MLQRKSKKAQGVRQSMFRKEIGGKNPQKSRHSNTAAQVWLKTCQIQVTDCYGVRTLFRKVTSTWTDRQIPYNKHDRDSEKSQAKDREHGKAHGEVESLWIHSCR